MESARSFSFFDEYKSKGNDIMISFDSFKTMADIISKGEEAIFCYE
jgi:hypothetical protein